MAETVVPNEMARQLGVTGLRFRDWLRAEKAAGHPLLSSHRYQQRWEFTRAESDQLMAQFAAQVLDQPMRQTPRPARSASSNA
jgi:hypothetical protein